MMLAEFLLARIDETEQMLVPLVDYFEFLGDQVVEARALVSADADAKRRIVTDWQRYERANGAPQVEGAKRGLSMSMKALAAVYADHPDYRQEWRP